MIDNIMGNIFDIKTKITSYNSKVKDAVSKIETDKENKEYNVQKLKNNLIIKLIEKD